MNKEKTEILIEHVYNTHSRILVHVSKLKWVLCLSSLYIYMYIGKNFQNEEIWI